MEILIDMKKLLTFIFLSISLVAFSQTTYYIDPSGVDNASRSGAIDQPWATLAYACTRVTTSGDIIYINDGTYTWNTKASFSVGVTARGESEAGTILNLTYVSSSASDAAIVFSSASLTNGNQSLSYMTITGSGLTSTRAILIEHRSNVDIHHCTIRNFAATGVHYKHQIDWMTPPSTYATGNDFYNNTVINCADRNYSSIDPGNLRIDGQENMNIYNCTFRNNERSEGYNGNTLNVTNCRGINIHDCSFTKPDDEGGQWNFYAEIFHLQGGFEMSYCTFTGSATIDFSNAYNGTTVRGSYDFAISVHDLYMSTVSGNQISQSGVGHNPVAIQIEKGEYEYCYIYNNHIKGYAYGIMFTTSTNYNNSMDHIYVYNNQLDNIGYTDYQYTYAIAFILENNSGYSVTLDNIHIINNTMYGGSGYNFNGIRWVANGTATNIHIKNNIVHSFDNYGIYFTIQSGESASINTMDVTYNDLYNNGTNTVYVSSSISQTAVNITSGNITSNPLFVSTTDFHLQVTSPAIGAGTATGQLSSADFDGVSWGASPAIGAFEYLAKAPSGTIYYVSTTGSNSNTGTSISSPWATISKINSVTFNPGDAIYFKRGDIWQEEVTLNPPSSGTSGDFITFGAYGSGDKPKLLGSVKENSTSDWTVYSGNIWQNNDASFSVNVGNLIFNNESSTGSYKTSMGALTTQGDFYFNTATHILYLYSVTNPASYYTNIECALDRPIIFLNGGEDYLTFENLDLRYSGGHAFDTRAGVTNINVRDCDISYIGGADWEDGASRYGNAIQFWESCSNVVIERNKIHDVMDAAITPQYSGSASITMSSFIARNNQIYNCEYSFEFFTSGCSGTVSGIYFQNNTCRNAGLGSFDGERPDGENGRFIMIWALSSSTTHSSFYIRNNIFDVADESAIHIATSAEPYVTFDYNCYNVTTVAYNGTTYTTLSSWQAHRSDEDNSISADPMLVSSTDWHLSPGSPCIGEGLNVGYTTDFNLVALNNPPDIGCYAYVSTPKGGDLDLSPAKKYGKWIMKNGKRAFK